MKTLSTLDRAGCNEKAFALKAILTETSARFVGVPRVFEKIEEGMKAAGAKSGLKKKVTRKYENRLYDEKQRILPRKSGLGLKKKVRKCLPAAYSSDKT